MIDRILETLRDELDTYLKALSKDNDRRVFIRPIVDSKGAVGIDENSIGITIIGTEEERIHQQQSAVIDGTQDGAAQYRHPDIRVSLYLLFAANSAKANHVSAWAWISQVMTFFQSKRVFNHTNTPGLPAKAEEFALDHYSLTFEQQNYVWSMLGAKYMPSVLYRLRNVLLVDERVTGERQPVRMIDTRTKAEL